MRQAILTVFLVLFLAACANKGQRGAGIEERSLGAPSQTAQEEQMRQQEEAKRREAQQQNAGADAPVIRSIAGTNAAGGQPLADASAKSKALADLLAQRSVYYDFDRYDIRDEYVPMIEAHAKFLVENPQYRIAVQGNCDSRGSREYNVALGQRRADQVKRTLVLLGVSQRQIQSTSFGAEKPVALGQSEDAWAKNRRSDVVYSTEPRIN